MISPLLPLSLGGVALAPVAVEGVPQVKCGSIATGQSGNPFPVGKFPYLEEGTLSRVMRERSLRGIQNSRERKRSHGERRRAREKKRERERWRERDRDGVARVERERAVLKFELRGEETPHVRG